MIQQIWKGWLDCVSEYIMYTFDKQGRQDWKPAHSETLLLSLSLWMIFTITRWIIRILWPRCWFCTSSGRPVWFHFTHICWKIAQGVWQLGTMSLSIFVLPTAPVIPYVGTWHSFCAFCGCLSKWVCLEIVIFENCIDRCWETMAKISGHR